MPETITLQEAQTDLAALIARLVPGEEVIITENDRPVAELRAVPSDFKQPRFGSSQGKLIILAEDDEHLKDFAEYMP
jgi:antitoxin (DNA-binding transcriptional repressor) of toxin-antitoxin stability system